MPLLGEIATVAAGYPFRGAIQPMEDGDARVLQMSDVAPETMPEWHDLRTTRLPGRKVPDWLQANDIVFVARGRHNFALHLPDVPVRAVCAPHFFVIRASCDIMLPAFLAWQLNQAPAQEQLDTIATGSYQRAIPASELKQMHVAVPPLKHQQLLITLHAAQLRERALYTALIENRKRELQAIASKLLTDNTRRTA